MHRRRKDCRHEEPEYLTLRWRFISSESENDFRKVLQICTEERIETLVSRSGWLWQQPQLFKKVIKSESWLSDWLATELPSFNLLMHIYYEETIARFRPGHWCIGTYYCKSHWLLTYLAKMFCNRQMLGRGRCHPSPPAASDSCQSRSRSPRSPDCCVATSCGQSQDDANIGFFVTKIVDIIIERLSYINI